jgi:acetyltransferase
MNLKNLTCFFNPQAVAVIGASERESSLGAKILSNLRASYPGPVYAVNPFRQTVQGIVAYPTISKIQTKIDLAIIATPAHTIPQIIEECGEAGVTGAIIVSAGFDVTQGQDLTRQIFRLQQMSGIRIIGPNSYGVISPKKGLYATFGDKKAIAGKIAFISQSAALCGTVLDWSQETHVGLSAVVSVGSAIDVKVSDLLEYFGNDAQTRAIMVYVESLTNVRDFMSSARGFARTKPIIIVKAGRFHGDIGFTISSVTKLTEDDIYDAAFRRIGIVRVHTISELFDSAKALSMQPKPNDPRLTIITNASGPGVLAADQLSLKGGALSKISVASEQALASVLPYYCKVSNPIDILEEATPQRYRNVLQVCLNDEASGSILVIYSPQGLTHPSNIANIAVELAETTTKTLLIALMGEDRSCQEARTLLNQKGIPSFRTPEEAVSAFMNMYMYTRNLESLYQTPQEVELKNGDDSPLKEKIRRAFCEGRQVLSLKESFSFLETYRIATVKTDVAKSVEEISVIINSCAGYPYALKPLYQYFSKETEVQPVDIYSPSELPSVFNEFFQKIKNRPFEYQGVVIQPKTRDSPQRFFLGLRKHRIFGSLVLFGAGSDHSKLIDVLNVGFPPLDQILARQILERTLRAYGSGDDSCRHKVEEVLVRFSQLVIDFPEFLAVDVGLIANEHGVTAADASITIDRSRIMREPASHPDEHLIIAPYPKKYCAERTLKNGTKVVFRPIKSEDEPCFNDLFKSLSSESVRFRFFEIIKELSHDALSRYCNLDYDREIAIVAQQENNEKIMGVVRLILDADRKKGEFAITVGDDWHGIGLGSKLMDYIIDIARDLKLSEIYSQVSSANYKMINLCKKMSFETQTVDEYTVQMSISL